MVMCTTPPFRAAVRLNSGVRRHGEEVAKGDRLRNPVKPDYVQALGLAAFTFATLEWQVVWSCERIQPGALRKIVDEALTAGTIAKRFIDLSRNMPKSEEREILKQIAADFSSLVITRNQILHGKPCAGQNGDSRLSSMGIIEIPELEEAADAFTECASRLNSIYYGFLMTYAVTQNP